MNQNSKLRTQTRQRIFIWAIAIVMIVGTAASMIAMVMTAQDPNLSPEQIAYQKELEEYEKYMESDEYKAYLEEQEKATETRRLSLRGLEGYEQHVAEFDAAAVAELKVETLQEGSGATVAAGATITANYTGWTPDGKIFDSTKTVGEDATAAEFPLDQVIVGWGNGLVGARAGGVYLLTIPADLAYGEDGSGDAIPPNTPLKFLVQVVDVANV